MNKLEKATGVALQVMVFVLFLPVSLIVAALVLTAPTEQDKANRSDIA